MDNLIDFGIVDLSYEEKFGTVSSWSSDMVFGVLLYEILLMVL